MSPNTKNSSMTISTFDGTNWASWSNKIKAQAQYDGLDGYLDGLVAPLRILTPKKMSTMTWESEMKYAEAVEKRNTMKAKAIGLITTNVSETIQDRIYAVHAVTDDTHIIWTWLKDTYDKKSVAVIFDTFGKAVRFRLHANQDPTSEIEKLRGYFTYLKNN